MKCILLLVLASAAVALGKNEMYSGYKAYRVDPVDKEQIRILYEAHRSFDADILQKPKVNGGEGYVIIPPDHLQRFEDFLTTNNIPFSIYAEDVKTALDQDEVMYEASRHKMASDGSRFNYNNFMRYDEMVSYLRDLGDRYPTLSVQADATSFQGRPIWYAKISTTNFEDTSKPVIVMEATVHAREWAAPPVATYAIEKLVSNITESDIVNNADWIIIPIANPDGYEFSHTNNRLWRKTRSPIGACFGTDPNRNFGHQWDYPGGGHSTNPCADDFRGPAPFSEPEVAFIRDVFHQYRDRMELYMSIHSFGSMILYPWSYTANLVPNALELQIVGVQAAAAIHAASIPLFGTYAVGTGETVLGYLASGTSDDYAYSIDCDLSYTYELPGLGSGFNGFLLPPQHIRQVAVETWYGVVVMARYAIQRHNSP